MSRVTRQNMRISNISEKVGKVVYRNDTAEPKSKELKINLEGHNTGKSVWVSNSFFESETARKNMIFLLEENLNREVSFGTRHIYIGSKLV